MNENIKCPYCGSSDYTGAGFGGNDTLTCNSCGRIFIGVNAEMIESPEAHECGNIPDDVPNFGARWNKPKGTFRPLPCVRDERGEMREQAIKQLFAKINEELDELKDACGFVRERNFDTVGEFRECQFNRRFDCIEIFQHIAEEAADTITAITTMLEALGIDAEMRDEAQRRVNSRNRERGRL